MTNIFSYRARDRNGKIFSGTILAENTAGAARVIRAQGLYITKVNALDYTSRISKIFTDRIPVGTKDLAVFCRQFAVMLEAGLSLTSCLDILVEQTANLRLQGAVREICGRIQSGESLAGAMKRYPWIFPVIMTSMIYAGEIGGVLDIVLDKLAVHFEKENILHEKVKSAMVYPSVVMGLALIITSFILAFVLPVFVKLFADMEVELPLLTSLLIQVYYFLQKYFLLFVSGFFLLGIGIFLVAKPSSIQKTIEKIIFLLPVFGPLARRIILARFCRTFSILIQGGVPILAALDTVKKTTVNDNMIEILSNAQLNVRNGCPLSSQLTDNKLFTPMAVRMLNVGEETGALDKMLDKVADFYERDIDDMMNRLSSLLEPVLMVFLGVVIGGVIIAIAMPLFDVISNFGARTM